jgi:hypothetical protein
MEEVIPALLLPLLVCFQRQVTYRAPLLTRMAKPLLKVILFSVIIIRVLISITSTTSKFFEGENVGKSIIGP